MNFSYTKRMVYVCLISNLFVEDHEKCESYVESKTTKKSCKNIERELELLSLFHGDLKDLKNTMTRGGKRFYITFLGDYSRYARLYVSFKK